MSLQDWAPHLKPLDATTWLRSLLSKVFHLERVGRNDGVGYWLHGCFEPTLVPWPEEVTFLESQNHSRWCHSHSRLVYFLIFSWGRKKQVNCVNNNLVPRALFQDKEKRPGDEVAWITPTCKRLRACQKPCQRVNLRSQGIRTYWRGVITVLSL